MTLQSDVSKQHVRQQLTAELTLEQCRLFYAEEIRAVTGLESPSLLTALRRVAREQFLGPPPWQIASGSALHHPSYRSTSEVRDLYHDVFVALDATRSLNNGQPSLILRLVAALDLAPGMRVAHIGCGTGYYTAILAETVGPTGSVVAIEVDPALAQIAATQLAHYPNVTVLDLDAQFFAPGPTDAMLVNTGLTHPPPNWLNALTPGGTMVLPLLVGRTQTTHDAMALRLRRTASALAADWISLLTIYPCTSLRQPNIQLQLNAAFESHSLLRARSLRRTVHRQAPSCVVHAPGFCLSADAP